MAKGVRDTLSPSTGRSLSRVADVRLLFPPLPSPGVEIGVRHELPAIEETLPNVADRPLHLPLRLSSIRPAGPHPKPPVTAEANELPVLDQPSALLAPIPDDDRRTEVPQGHPRNKWRPSPPASSCARNRNHNNRESQNHDQGVPLAPRQPEVCKVHLPLVPRRGLELGPVPAPPVAPLLRMPSRLPGTPRRRQLRILGQTSVDDRLVRIQLRPHRASVRTGPFPPSLPGSTDPLDPVVDRPPADPTAARWRQLQVSQQHPLVAPKHNVSSSRLVTKSRPRGELLPSLGPPLKADQKCAISHGAQLSTATSVQFSMAANRPSQHCRRE